MIGERSFGNNYKKFVEDQEEVKDYDKKTNTLTIEAEDPGFIMAHVAGKLLESKVLADFFTDDNNRPIEVNMVGDLKYGDIKKTKNASFDYGAIKINVTSSPENTDKIEKVETKIINSSVIPKK